MRRMKNVDIEFPWQIEALLVGVSFVISASAASFFCIYFYSVVGAAFESVFIGLGTTTHPDLALGAWMRPLTLVAFLTIFIRVYSGLRKMLARMDRVL